MLKDRSGLEKNLVAICSQIDDNKVFQDYCIKLEKQFDLPISLSSDILSLRKDLSEIDRFTLFAITYILNHQLLTRYFTEIEIKNYSTQKYKDENKVQFPIKLDMFEVKPDQWIGVSSVKFLMQLRDEQYINYNANTQRALSIMVKDGKEVYRPSVDIKAVKEIEKAYQSGAFIPNTISLNINQDDENANFEFKNNVLTIYSITAFDIFDGYHRYLGMGRNYDRNNDFDYPTELRITNFSVSKAKQFIYQEDHKTKMKKIVQATYDQQNSGNIVCDRLNTDSSFNLYNKINLTDGFINYGELSAAINAIYFDNQKVDRKEIIRISNELKEKLNKFTEEIDSYLERRWKRYEVYIIVYGIKNNISPTDVYNIIDNADEDKIKIINKFGQGISKKRLLTTLKEVSGNV